MTSAEDGVVVKMPGLVSSNVSHLLLAGEASVQSMQCLWTADQDCRQWIDTCEIQNMSDRLS
jgi:hypothetical protein